MENKIKIKSQTVALAPKRPALAEHQLVTGSIDEQYEQAVAFDRANIFKAVKGPSLFNWFVGMNSMVAGFALVLFSRLVEDFQTGRFSDWFLPLQAAFILGGLGLILSEMAQKSSQLWKVVFRLVVAVSFGALSLIWWQGGEFDGVFITLLLALVILFNVVADVSSLRSYLIFYQGLLVGLAVIYYFFPSYTGLADGLGQLIGASLWPGLLLVLVVVVYGGLTWFSYYRNKRWLSLLIGITSVPLAILAFVYGNASEWVRSFLVLTTALFAFLLPFWDELRFRQGSHRDWVTRMFAVVLALFLMTVVLIRVLQNILITNTELVLSDKVTYGRIFADGVVNNTMSAVKSLAENQIFKRALIRNETTNLLDLSRGFFESNRSLIRIVAVDEMGKILSVYPLGGGLAGEDINTAEYFSKVMVSGLADISDVFEPTVLKVVDERTVALTVPVIENNQTVGSLIGFLNLQALSDGLQEIATPASGESFVMTDKAGTWLVAPVSETGAGDPLVVTLIQRGIVRQGYNKDGVLTLGAYQELSPTGWRLILVQPLFAALAINQTAYVVVLALASLSALIIGLTVLIERQVSQDENE